MSCLPLASLSVTLSVSCAMGVACALLSVIVVIRRWAFIGEGIAHSGFGGAGVAWLLCLLFPSAAWVASAGGIYFIAVLFCLLVAWVIGMVTRRQQVRSDTAIGIVLVASLAWGFAAAGVYGKLRGTTPPAWEEFLIGNMSELDAPFVMAAGAICAAVVLVIFALNKEIVAYCFDPVLAEISGVRVGLVHYLLILMVATTIILGRRLTGSLLITALLVLPGATALQLTRRFGVVMGVAVAAGLIGAIAGPLVHWKWNFIPEGPAVVLALVVEFGVAYVWGRAWRDSVMSQ